MKILIDGQTLRTPEIKRGIGTYFKNTIEQILQLDFTSDFYINLPTNDDPEFLYALSEWARGKLRVCVDAAFNSSHSEDPDQAALNYSAGINRFLRDERIDVYWCPNPLMPNVWLPKRESNCVFAATIYDLIVLVMRDVYLDRWHTTISKAYKAKLHTLESYDLFLHISQHTRNDFVRHIRSVAGKPNVVTPLAADERFSPDPFPSVARADDYVLYVGGADLRKNVDGALAAFAQLHKTAAEDELVRNTTLRIVCAIDEQTRADYLRRARAAGVEARVTFSGFVDDDRLRHLYRKARCLFFPSLYEGFGLPVLEALACGVPIAVSNNSSLPEVGGEHAIYFDPHDADDMARALGRALREPNDVEARFARYAYARSFSWQQTAMQTIDAFVAGCKTLQHANAASGQEDGALFKTRSNSPNSRDLTA